MTLLQALQSKGGSATEGAAQIVARAAVAAWLNAAYDDEGHLQVPWRRHDAAVGKPPLDIANNLGCPLS
jgi:hypothetical protein